MPLARLICTFIAWTILTLASAYAADSVPTDVQQPGTQPGEIGAIESAESCNNCHGGYDKSVEPGHNWGGSMMAHAGRDPIFWASVAIAEQDFDGAGDSCIRCHSTGGWLAGRSTPTDGSRLTAGDSDGVECDFCHRLTNPDNSEHIGETNTPFITNEPADYDSLFDWDEPNGIEGYLGSGIASIWSGDAKLGPYDNARGPHQFMQSAFHRDRDFCGTCHDVSNPVVGNLAHNNGSQATADPVISDGTLGGSVEGKAAFNNPPYKYGLVERTFSEYKAGLISQTLISDYPSLPKDLQGGALAATYKAATRDGTTDGNYQNPVAPRYFSCQSCHMRPVTGKAARQNSARLRHDLPLHDITGGNYWMPRAIQYLDNQGKLRLGGDMTQAQTNAMLDGALRAREQLSLAATLVLSENEDSVKIINHTGHKLISGYPEGRRMWLNIKWYSGSGNPLREDGKYGEIGVTIDSVRVKSLIDLDGSNTRIYEAHMGTTQQWAGQLLALDPEHYGPLVLDYDRLTGEPGLTIGELAAMPTGTEYESFHFMLNNTMMKDNRIPPYGMSYDLARIRNALPVPANQYGGGSPGEIYDYFDEVALNPPPGAQSATIRLMYQPTSWEYIQFLNLANTTAQGSFLADQGKTMLEAWLNTGMAEPQIMTSTTWGTPPNTCNITPPEMLRAHPGDGRVSLRWRALPGDSHIAGYRLYYYDAGVTQPVAEVSCPDNSSNGCNTYIDRGLINNQQYCYKVVSYGAACESGFSDVLCAIPEKDDGDTQAGLASLTTGRWVKRGNGQRARFVAGSEFTAGEAVVIQAIARDSDGKPVAGATVSITISGPETATLITGPSNANGIAKATWRTRAPAAGRSGTATGQYTATATGLSASGLTWDQKPVSATFKLAR